jgi:hypothetical protein
MSGFKAKIFGQYILADESTHPNFATLSDPSTVGGNSGNK